MEKKSIFFKPHGMQRDISPSLANKDYAYDIRNMRVTAVSENTTMTLVNEKGTGKLETTGDELKGTPIGQAVINNQLVIFSCDVSGNDRIYKVSFNDNNIAEVNELYSGNLGFDYKHPIETLVFYENEQLQKVYWVDGINQPRMINIAADNDARERWNDDSFNFVRKVKLANVDINRIDSSNGFFAAGVMQYVFTYATLYGQESQPFYVSPLYYTSFSDRGGSPEDKVSCAFDITITDADTSFDYVRVYSLLRTSEEATPMAKRVIDLAISPEDGTKTEFWNYRMSSNLVTINGKSVEEFFNDAEGEYGLSKTIEGIELSNQDGSLRITSDALVLITWYKDTQTLYIHGVRQRLVVHEFTNKIHYVDTGVNGDDIDPSDLLFLGGEAITAGTMTQKDNTLFLGDIVEQVHTISSDVFEFAMGRASSLAFHADKAIDVGEPRGYYTYAHQLNKNSAQIKTFKYKEWYRFGFQAMYKTGKWSEPIWIADKQNDKHPMTTFYNNSPVNLVTASVSITNNIISILREQGFIAIRPLIVYPSYEDRECICQGVLNPTVFNIEDRYSNAPFAQASWYFRPYSPCSIDAMSTGGVAGETPREGDWSAYGLSSTGGLTFTHYISRAGFLEDSMIDVSTVGAPASISEVPGLDGKGTRSAEPIATLPLTSQFDLSYFGSRAECRHLHAVNGETPRSLEIQCMQNAPKYLTVPNSQIDKSDFVHDYGETFYVDQSIVTLNSPDIEFDERIRNADLSRAKLRIVGAIPFTSFFSDVDIQVSTTVEVLDAYEPPYGFYKERVGVPMGFEDVSINDGASNNPEVYKNMLRESHFGYRTLIAAPMWFDSWHGEYSENWDDFKSKYGFGFLVYPWHRNGSLSNWRSAEEGYRGSMLDKKKESTYRFSYKTIFLENSHIWKPRRGISGVALFDSNEQTMVKIPEPKGSKLGELNYYGNFDKVVTMNGLGENGDNTGYDILYTENRKTNGGVAQRNEKGTLHDFYSGGVPVRSGDVLKFPSGREIPIGKQGLSTDPVRIKYKSTPHAVMALNYLDHSDIEADPLNEGMYMYGLPVMTERFLLDENPLYKTIDNYSFQDFKDGKVLFWDNEGIVRSLWQDSLGFNANNELQGPIKAYESLQYGFLWLGELYRDSEDVKNRFGGVSQEAFENNEWLPCGETVSITDSDEVTLVWNEGDTYLQRYDAIKTYPYTLEDQNSITDILSFMVETRVNLDGRYDKNRGNMSALALTPENFNKVNQVYSQDNDFFMYRGLNKDRIDLDNFHNVITWTKTKTAGELTDNWTNITLASILDLDGDKGSVRALRRFNNNIIAFQDNAISQILYNENVQINASDGLPIEIANSGKVQGKKYFAELVGCNNKWSICEAPGGIYFIDDKTNSIYIFNGQLASLSDKNVFHSWVENNTEGLKSWNPVDFDNIITYYDKVNSDVFFITKNECLAYSEGFGTFTAFYDYGHVPFFANVRDRGIWSNIGENNEACSLWGHQEGEYNMFFGKYKPFSVTVIANPNPVQDKTFDNLEFRADSWDKDGTLLKSTFDKLYVWNEYQEAEAELTFKKDIPSNLKKKFRIWRTIIPRSRNTRDRIRNPWTYVKLVMERENTDKTMLHDMMVYYFEQ